MLQAFSLCHCSERLGSLAFETLQQPNTFIRCLLLHNGLNFCLVLLFCVDSRSIRKWWIFSPPVCVGLVACTFYLQLPPAEEKMPHDWLISSPWLRYCGDDHLARVLLALWHISNKDSHRPIGALQTIHGPRMIFSLLSCRTLIRLLSFPSNEGRNAFDLFMVILVTHVCNWYFNYAAYCEWFRMNVPVMSRSFFSTAYSSGAASLDYPSSRCYNKTR